MYPNYNQGYQPTYPQIQPVNYNGYQYPVTQRTNSINTYMPQSTNPTVQDSSQQSPTNGLIGRMVDQTDEIMPSEIRMDGSLGFFPMRDLSAIYVKQWDQNANLQTIRYVPEQIVEQQDTNYNNNQFAMLGDILDQLNDIQNLLKKNNYKSGRSSNYKKKNYNKKAVNDVQDA